MPSLYCQPTGGHSRRSQDNANDNGNDASSVVLQQDQQQQQRIREEHYFVQQLMRHHHHQQQSNKTSSPPPASCSALAYLPRVRIFPQDRVLFEHDKTACSICCERLLDGMILLKLPCGHKFHLKCIVPWMNKCCTCPECRYEVKTDHPVYEIGRVERMMHRETVSCTCKRSEHTCFFGPQSGAGLEHSSKRTSRSSGGSSSGKNQSKEPEPRRGHFKNVQTLINV